MGFDDFGFDGLQPIGVLAVTPPRPGRAGTPNTFVVTGAEPHEPLLLWIDMGGPGLAQVPMIVSLVADSLGEARHTLDVPAALSGLPIRARVAAPSADKSPWVSDVLAPLASGSSLQVAPISLGSKKAPIPPE